METLVPKNPNCSNLHQTLIPFPPINHTQVIESPIDQTKIINSPIIQTKAIESPIEKSHVIESPIDKTHFIESPIEKTHFIESPIDQTQVIELPIEKTHFIKSPINQTQVFEPTINQTHFIESPIDQTLGNDSSSNSSFKSVEGEEEGFPEDQSDTYHDAQGPVEDDDDVDYDLPELEPKGKTETSCWLSSWNGNNRKNEGSYSGYSSWFRSDFDSFDDSAMVGAGLYNLGNTCFLNAILQCFTHTVPLIKGLRSYNHPKPCKRDIEGFCVFCALHDHIEVAIARKGKSLSPMRIVDNLNQLSSGFRRYQQEDAHELLQCLLDKLDTCCTSLKTDENHESLVHRLFGGRLVSKLKCCNCGHCSDTFEPLIDLSLEIENADSLDHALESFTKVEKIEDEDPQFECESCKEKVAVEKQLMVDHAPSIAAFHLKRFKNDGSYVEKKDMHVEFPLELDLKPYTSGSQNDNVDLNYSLYAIVVHSGFLPTSGHYFCFIRSTPDAWYRLDDSQVTKVSESHVLSRDAYILLYAKNGTPWFSTFMETEKPLDSYVSSPSPKSVLENASKSSESSPIMEANNISERNEEDKLEAPAISGLSFNSFKNEDEIGVAKFNSKFDKKFVPSTSGGNKLVISGNLLESIIDNRNHKFETSPSKNIFCDVDDEDRDDAMEISTSSCGQQNKINEGKKDIKVDKGMSAPAVRGEYSYRADSEFTKSDDFKSSTSRSYSWPIRIPKLSFEDLDEGDKESFKVEKKTSPSALKDEFEKGADIKSSTISGLAYSTKPCSIPRDHVMIEKELPRKRQASDDTATKLASDNTAKKMGSDDTAKKLACSLLKRGPCSNRRAQFLAVVNCNRDLSHSNKKTKIK